MVFDMSKMFHIFTGEIVGFDHPMNGFVSCPSHLLSDTSLNDTIMAKKEFRKGEKVAKAAAAKPSFLENKKVPVKYRAKMDKIPNKTEGKRAIITIFPRGSRKWIKRAKKALALLWAIT